MVSGFVWRWERDGYRVRGQVLRNETSLGYPTRHHRNMQEVEAHVHMVANKSTPRGRGEDVEGKK